MNKFTKGILSLGIALSILAGATGVTAFAASKTDKKSGSIGSNYTSGSSTIDDRTASAYTSFGNNGTVSVNSTYDYVRLSDVKGFTSTRSNGHYHSTSVSFSVGENYRSVKIKSDHYVAGSGQTWTAKTSVIR